MTNEQLIVIKNNVTVTKPNTLFNGVTLLQLWNNNDTENLANYYNTIADPIIEIWRSDIRASELTAGIVGSEYVVLTAVKQNAFFMYLTAGEVDATSPNVQASFQAIFGNSVTKTNLIAIAKKAATNLEALFTSGGISSLYNYRVSGQDIYKAKEQ